MYKRLQEYNTSLQQYNSKLQTDLETVRAALTRAEKEKSSILENLSTLRGHSKSLQDQLSSSRVSFSSLPLALLSRANFNWSHFFLTCSSSFFCDQGVAR